MFMLSFIFMRPTREGPYYVIGYVRRVGVHTGFCTITLVLYIRSLPNLATWFPCGRGRTLFIFGSLPLYHLIIYIDGHNLWCTHFLLWYYLVYLSGSDSVQAFYHLLVSIAVGDPSIKRGRLGSHYLVWSCTFLCLSQSRTWISYVICDGGSLCSMRWEVIQ